MEKSSEYGRKNFVIHCYKGVCRKYGLRINLSEEVWFSNRAFCVMLF